MSSDASGEQTPEEVQTPQEAETPVTGDEADDAVLDTTLDKDVLEVKLMEAAAEYAAKQYEIEFFDEEQELKRQLERTKARKELAMAEAKFKIYTQMSGKSENQPTAKVTPQAHDDIVGAVKSTFIVERSSSQREASQSAGICNTTTNGPPPLVGPPTPAARRLNPAASTFSPTCIDEQTSLAKAIADSVSLSRLPVPEPAIFSGDCLHYLEWKTAFNCLIERR